MMTSWNPGYLPYFFQMVCDQHLSSHYALKTQNLSLHESKYFFTYIQMCAKIDLYILNSRETMAHKPHQKRHIVCRQYTVKTWFRSGHLSNCRPFWRFTWKSSWCCESPPPPSPLRLPLHPPHTPPLHSPFMGSSHRQPWCYQGVIKADNNNQFLSEH